MTKPPAGWRDERVVDLPHDAVITCLSAALPEAFDATFECHDTDEGRRLSGTHRRGGKRFDIAIEARPAGTTTELQTEVKVASTLSSSLMRAAAVMAASLAWLVVAAFFVRFWRGMADPLQAVLLLLGPLILSGLAYRSVRGSSGVVTPLLEDVLDGIEGVHRRVDARAAGPRVADYRTGPRVVLDVEAKVEQAPADEQLAAAAGRILERRR